MTKQCGQVSSKCAVRKATAIFFSIFFIPHLSNVYLNVGILKNVVKNLVVVETIAIEIFLAGFFFKKLTVSMNE